MDIQPVVVDQGLLRARGDPGGGGEGGGGEGQPWAGGDLEEGDSGSKETWARGDFGELSTWSEGTPRSARAPHFSRPHMICLIQILLLT